MINKKILYCSLSLILGGIFFVIHDAIINHLTEVEFKFYHHVFFGSPWLIIIFIYLYFTGNIKTYLESSNYSVLILRGFLFLPLPYMLFVSLQNISLPEWTTLNMISPILGSILAILFLGEKINYLTTIAIFIGFIGVILIIQPGFQDFSFYYLFPVYGHARGFQLKDYAQRHPGGAIGRTLLLSVKEIMRTGTRFATVPSGQPVREAILAMTAAQSGSVAILDPHQKLLGILTDGDLRRALQDHSADRWTDLTATDLMTADPITVEGDVLVVNALERMERNRRKPISVLPVVNSDARMMGLLRLHDLIQAGLA